MENKDSLLRRAWINAGLVLTGLVAGLLLVEGYLRYVERYGDYFWKEDPFVGYVGNPNSTVLYKRPCLEVTVRFNSKGFRDVEHPLEKPPGVYRIVILGDSFTANLQVKLEESYHRILEKLLNGAGLGKRFETINLGQQAF